MTGWSVSQIPVLLFSTTNKITKFDDKRESMTQCTVFNVAEANPSMMLLKQMRFGLSGPENISPFEAEHVLVKHQGSKYNIYPRLARAVKRKNTLLFI